MYHHQLGSEQEAYVVTECLYGEIIRMCVGCRDYGQRVSDRQKTRLMWLVEDMGAQKFRETVSSYIGYDLKPGKHVTVSVSCSSALAYMQILSLGPPVCCGSVCAYLF